MSKKLEEFHFSTGQEVFVREDNSKWLVQICHYDDPSFKSGALPSYTINSLERREPCVVRQNWISSNKNQKFMDCPFRVGDTVYVNGVKTLVLDVLEESNSILIKTDLVEHEQISWKAVSFSKHRKEQSTKDPRSIK